MLKQKNAPYIPKLKTLINEINNMLRSQKSLMEFILREEKNELVEHRKGRPKQFNQDWDREF